MDERTEYEGQHSFEGMKVQNMTDIIYPEWMNAQNMTDSISPEWINVKNMKGCTHFRV
jgi:hypothetical protein